MHWTSASRFCRAIWIATITLLGASRAQGVTVSTVGELRAAIEAANAGGDKTIEIEDGTYTLDQLLHVTADGVTVRGGSGDRDAVILEGQGMGGGVSHIFLVRGSDFTVRDMTLRGVANHLIQVQGEQDADRPVISNLHLVDAYEQMIKVSCDAAHPETGSDDGQVEGCHFEYSAGIGPQYYIGGVDAHCATGWIVRDNRFEHIRSPEAALAEHAIHFWSGSEGTIAERNLIIDCDRGIGFGLGDRGHTGGIIRNNMIHRGENAGDVAIGLESSPDTRVINNTVFYLDAYPNAIEYRFSATTNVQIVNNLTNKNIQARDGASGTESSNVDGAEGSWFVDAAGADLHLASRVAGVADSGEEVAGLVDDFDRGPRPEGAGIDIGADEYNSPSGDTTPPRAPTGLVVE